MNTGARWREWLRPAALPVRRNLFVACAVLLLLSLGAPWKRTSGPGKGGVLYAPMFKVVTPIDFEGGAVTSPTSPTALIPDWTGTWVTVLPGAGGVAGTAHPARVPIAVAGVLGFLAVRRRSRRLMAAALVTAAVGLILTSGDSLLSPGWILLAVAAILAAVGSELIPFAAVPHRASRSAPVSTKSTTDSAPLAVKKAAFSRE